MAFVIAEPCIGVKDTEFGRLPCGFGRRVAGFGFVVRRSFTGASRGGRSHRSGLYAFVYGFAELD